MLGIWAVVPRNTTGILVGNVKITGGRERKVEWVEQLRIVLRVVSYEGAYKIMLSFRIRFSRKPQNLARFTVGVHHIEIFIRAETEPAQLSQLDVVWQAFSIQRFTQLFARLGINMDVVPGVVLGSAMEAYIPDAHRCS